MKVSAKPVTKKGVESSHQAGNEKRLILPKENGLKVPAKLVTKKGVGVPARLVTNANAGEGSRQSNFW